MKNSRKIIYYSALSIDACAAAKRAKGTRKGEHET